jgi:undecaprenyl diphosphate synthase
MAKSEIDISKLNIPNHIAIILDGNGRWAKKRMMPRNYGHAKGAKAVEQICEDAYNIGINYLTVYAFSTENWKRPKDEVDALMKLLSDYLEDSLSRATKNNMCVKVIGDKTALSIDLQNKIEKLETVTKDNTGLHFTIALNYGSRDEIVRAIKKVAADVKNEKLGVEDITEQVYSNYLDTKGIPDPDLLIRTSGEERLSNYLLWQLAYTEFYFTDCLWPDFDKKELLKAIVEYTKRDRRFGKVSQQEEE